MKSVPNPGDKVYIDFVYERIPAVIISEISGKLFNNPGFIWCVKLIKNDRIFVKAISVYNLIERTDEAIIDTAGKLPELKPWERAYSRRHHYAYFHKSPLVHRNRRRQAG